MLVCKAYPPRAVFKQSFRTALHAPGGIRKKTSAPTEAVEELQSSAEATRLFTPAGQDLKCLIDREFTVDEIDSLVRWCESVRQEIAKYGPKLPPEE